MSFLLMLILWLTTQTRCFQCFVHFCWSCCLRYALAARLTMLVLFSFLSFFFFFFVAFFIFFFSFVFLFLSYLHFTAQLTVLRTQFNIFLLFELHSKECFQPAQKCWCTERHEICSYRTPSEHLHMSSQCTSHTPSPVSWTCKIHTCSLISP